MNFTDKPLDQNISNDSLTRHSQKRKLSFSKDLDLLEMNRVDPSSETVVNKENSLVSPFSNKKQHLFSHKRTNDSAICLSSSTSVFDRYTGKKVCLAQNSSTVHENDSRICLSSSVTSSNVNVSAGKKVISKSNYKDKIHGNDILMKSFQKLKGVTLDCKEPLNDTVPKMFLPDWSVSMKERFNNNISSISITGKDEIGKDTSAISSRKLVEYIPKNKISCNSLSDINASWNNPVFGTTSQFALPSVVKSKQVLSRKSFDHVYSSVSFKKAMLNDVEVLGQVDDKFISCVLSAHSKNRILVLIDQHAAHERIRLEKLLKQIGYYSKDYRKSLIKNQVTRLSPPALISFYESEIDLIRHYRKEFNDIGLHFSQMKAKNSSTKQNFLISTVPSVFINVCNIQLEAKGSVLNTQLIKEFIQEQLNYMRTTNSNCNMSSATIFKVLASHACHGAIKFGDKLSYKTCRNMVKELSRCNLPFQCAHGRPSIAPLVNLSMLSSLGLNRKVEKLNFSRLKSTILS